ncbi:MAG: hypothetical protein K9J45_17315 [Bacteroidales bacterium]|nr:hypothetical protein [Bacteroidales bacterium]MCF8313951.1 hypothetical protein [Saprospiraceae bacterium]
MEKSYLDIGPRLVVEVLIFMSEPFTTRTPLPFAPKGFKISCKERQSQAIGKIFLGKPFNCGRLGQFLKK